MLSAGKKSLGKGEAVSSILTGSTINHFEIKRKSAAASYAECAETHGTSREQTRGLGGNPGSAFHYCSGAPPGQRRTATRADYIRSLTARMYAMRAVLIDVV